MESNPHASLLRSGFYAVFSGESLPTEQIVKAIQTASDVRQQAGHHWIVMHDYAAIVRGLDGTSCQRFWFYVPGFEQSYKAVVLKIQAALHWDNFEVRWEYAAKDALLPPNITEIEKCGAVPSKLYRHTLIVVVFFVLSPLAMVATDHRGLRTSGWSAALFIGCWCAFACWCLSSYVKRQYPSFLVICFLYALTLWFGRGGPWQPLWEAVLSLGAFCLPCYLLLLCPLFYRRTRNPAKESIDLNWSYRRGDLSDFLRNQVHKAVKEQCLACGYSLHGLDTCRCPECATENYYLTDRADARALAEKHGAVFEGEWAPHAPPHAAGLNKSGGAKQERRG